MKLLKPERDKKDQNHRYNHVLDISLSLAVIYNSAAKDSPWLTPYNASVTVSRISRISILFSRRRRKYRIGDQSSKKNYKESVVTSWEISYRILTRFDGKFVRSAPDLRYIRRSPPSASAGFCDDFRYFVRQIAERLRSPPTGSEAIGEYIGECGTPSHDALRSPPTASEALGDAQRRYLRPNSLVPIAAPWVYLADTAIFDSNRGVQTFPQSCGSSQILGRRPATNRRVPLLIGECVGDGKILRQISNF